MASKHSIEDARVGDWIEARGIHGEHPRRGEIVEIVGEPGHHRLRVRWDEGHESLVYPADGITVVRDRSRH
ncbi:MAG TPA: DUF1918 domain-containing protein [Solirubrobacteraceae bacterium]|nr:DUF1918 domain-containing protein [Solirubrobacteraceae bacterium]